MFSFCLTDGDFLAHFLAHNFSSAYWAACLDEHQHHIYQALFIPHCRATVPILDSGLHGYQRVTSIVSLLSGLLSVGCTALSTFSTLYPGLGHSALGTGLMRRAQRALAAA